MGNPVPGRGRTDPGIRGVITVYLPTKEQREISEVNLTCRRQRRTPKLSGLRGVWPMAGNKDFYNCCGDFLCGRNAALYEVCILFPFTLFNYWSVTDPIFSRSVRYGFTCRLKAWLFTYLFIIFTYGTPFSFTHSSFQYIKCGGGTVLHFRDKVLQFFLLVFSHQTTLGPWLTSTSFQAWLWFCWAIFSHQNLLGSVKVY
jgi:hypothetical protein